MEEVFVKICKVTLYCMAGLGLLFFWGLLLYGCVEGIQYLYNLLM